MVGVQDRALMSGAALRLQLRMADLPFCLSFRTLLLSLARVQEFADVELLSADVLGPDEAGSKLIGHVEASMGNLDGFDYSPQENAGLVETGCLTILFLMLSRWCVCVLRAKKGVPMSTAATTATMPQVLNGLLEYQGFAMPSDDAAAVAAAAQAVQAAIEDVRMGRQPQRRGHAACAWRSKLPIALLTSRSSSGSDATPHSLGATPSSRATSQENLGSSRRGSAAAIVPRCRAAASSIRMLSSRSSRGSSSVLSSPRSPSSHLGQAPPAI